MKMIPSPALVAGLAVALMMAGVTESRAQFPSTTFPPSVVTPPPSFNPPGGVVTTPGGVVTTPGGVVTTPGGPLTATTAASVFAATPTGVAVTGLGGVQQIFEVTQLVPVGAAAVAVFTVPTGSRLIVTDLVLTNASVAPTCGADLLRGGLSVIGGLCVPAQATLPITLLSGIEFGPGLLMQLANGGVAELSIHVRGFLLGV